MNSLKTLGFVAFACLLSPLAAAENRKPPGEKYALLVGVREYDKNELRTLRFSENDVAELAKTLKANGYRQVILMTQTEGATKSRLLPLAKNIREELKGILEDRDENDSVVIAFTGHGVQFKNTDAHYFCPMDAKLTDPATLISLKDVYAEMETCKAGLKLLMVDACRNDPQSDNSKSRAEVDLESVTRPQRLRPPGGIAAFFSCSPGEKSYEIDELKHGVFFHYILDGLRGRADFDHDNKVDLDELVLYAKKQVPIRVKDEFGATIKQKPELVGKTNGTVFLTTIDRPVPSRTGEGRVPPSKTITESIIEKALAAHGGLEKLAEFDKKGAITISKGTLYSDGVARKMSMLTVEGQDGKVKHDIDSEYMGTKVKMIIIFDGENYWVTANGEDRRHVFQKNTPAELKEQQYQEKAWIKVLLGDKRLALSPLGEAQVKGRAAVGIRATSKGHRDVNLYFDKEYGLLVKMEFHSIDILSGKGQLTEHFMSRYKLMEGLPRPMKIAVNQDGKKSTEMEVLEFTLTDTISDSEFAKP